MTIQQMLDAATSKLGLSTGLVIMAVRLGWWEITSRLPNLITEEEKEIVKDVLSEMEAPEDIALFKAVITWIDTKIPNAGSAKYGIAAAYIVAQYKDLKPYQTQIAALLEACGDAAKTGISGSEQSKA